MQVTANPLLPVSSPLSTAPAAANTGQISVLSVNPIWVEDQVSLGQRQEAPSTYDKPAVVYTGLRDTSPRGSAAASVGNNLISSLNSVRSKKAPFMASSIFSQIGALSGETREYRNEARQFSAAADAAVDKLRPNFSLSTTALKESIMLEIRTRDGDSILIELKHSSVGSDSALAFSMLVDGELSPEEQKALGRLADKLGQVADEFFRSDTAELRGLKDIDTSIISSFSLNLSRPQGDTRVTHTYEYTVDESAQTQTLTAKDINDYSVEVTAHLQGLATGKPAHAEILQAYVDLINQSAENADTNNKSKRFMRDAFSAVFSSFIGLPEPTAETRKRDAILAAFDSGLPDFKASIRSPVIHNPNFYTQASSLVLTLEQETRIERSNHQLWVAQESRYELINNRFDGMPGVTEGPDLEGGNYSYITQHVVGSIKRSLALTGDRVDSLVLERERKETTETHVFSNHRQVSVEPYEQETRALQDYNVLLRALDNPQPIWALNKLVSPEKEIYFLQ
ncbi:hypothetical protein [Cellvibrio japonicus]|uniref:Uncharacterized protein n=2 Tax=Cellvibrio japonicus TaxID=155077 RepID=B3PCG6_CELJU|nr:hypothetical protein [Cellvibrio japonicus]ACE85395.1 hypothetical protein CJA_1283 [Cellvibrio japonicus Ueda107]QEI11870.1 hypothetical protein FY117_06255 [Cellvibrio japonicus]QEI15444.1 hypothetical protein FY116_06255 [Cellvibrio japonicus]QEI19023.1 hypothetical protein FY115_06255 [Cellvibrio japonicus]